MPTLDNGLVADNKLLGVGIEPGAGYVVGDPSVAAVLIVNSTLPKLSILGGGGSVPSGGGATFTIVADQAPLNDISVQYTVTGTAQQGKDLQPVTGSAILPAGATSVDVSILTLNTNVFFVPTDMIAIGGPTQLGQVFVKEGQIIPAGTPLFSLTETNLTVTIDVSAADRTKLKVGQAVTVEVQGGTQSAPGVITAARRLPHHRQADTEADVPGQGAGARRPRRRRRHPGDREGRHPGTARRAHRAHRGGAPERRRQGRRAGDRPLARARPARCGSRPASPRARTSR